MAYGVFLFGHGFFRDTPRLVGAISGYHMIALGILVLGGVRFAQRSTEGLPSNARQAE